MKTLLVVDIDNTVAENQQREHLLPNWEAFYHACDGDTPIVDIIDALKPFFEREDIDVIFVTGRTGYDGVKTKTQTWLDAHFPQRPVFYRAKNDFSKAHIYKNNVVNGHKTRDHTRIVVVDDDERICAHFRALGHEGVQIDKNNYAGNVAEIARVLADVAPKHAQEDSSSHFRHG